MYRVDLRHRVQQSLEKLQAKDRRMIIEALLGLEQDPRPKGVEKIRRTELWRIRKGDYRIVYQVADEDKVITVVRIGHRRDVYRGI
jgi:mRNA interferase RelE/StbE